MICELIFGGALVNRKHLQVFRHVCIFGRDVADEFDEYTAFRELF